MRFIFAILALGATCDAFVPPSGFGQPASTQLHMANPSTSVFLTPETAKKCVEVAGGSPLYVYSLDMLEESANSPLPMD